MDTELEIQRFAPTDFALVPDGGTLTLDGLGNSVLDRWRKGKYYRVGVTDEEQFNTLDFFLRVMMVSHVTIDLPSTGRYTGKAVEWLPGHIIGDKELGPKHSKFMVVGKMPGLEESDKRRYWVGPAGRMLAKLFAQYHMALTECYGTNVVKFLPPYPNMSTIPADWVRQCLWFLKQEFRIVKPEYTLLLGADAVKAVFGRNAKLSAYRGLVTEYEGCKILVANNPSDILRNPEKMDMFRSDISLFCQTARGEAVKAADVKYHYIRDEQKLKEVIDNCMAFGTFAVDCEWSGANWMEGHLLTIQFSKQAK